MGGLGIFGRTADLKGADLPYRWGKRENGRYQPGIEGTGEKQRKSEGSGGRQRKQEPEKGEERTEAPARALIGGPRELCKRLLQEIGKTGKMGNGSRALSTV